jgi:hypothetical protein
MRGYYEKQLFAIIMMGGVAEGVRRRTVLDEDLCHVK